MRCIIKLIHSKSFRWWRSFAIDRRTISDWSKFMKKIWQHWRSSWKEWWRHLAEMISNNGLSTNKMADFKCELFVRAFFCKFPSFYANFCNLRVSFAVYLFQLTKMCVISVRCVRNWLEITGNNVHSTLRHRWPYLKYGGRDSVSKNKKNWFQISTRFHLESVCIVI